MFVPDQKKCEVWNHFLAQEFLTKTFPQITGTKLRKIKREIFDWDFFWQDVVVRHGLWNKYPDLLQIEDKAAYDHCQGNFWGMIYQVLVEKGMIK